MNTTAGTVIAVTGKNSLSDGLIKGSGASLTALARAINIQSLLAKGKALAAIKHATECGRLLLEVKEKLAHGEFGPWIKANCEFSIATANNYMRVAKNPNALGKSGTMRSLYPSGFSEARKRIAGETLSEPEKNPSKAKPVYEPRIIEGTSTLMSGAPSRRAMTADEAIEILKALALAGNANFSPVLSQVRTCRSLVTKFRNQLAKAEKDLAIAEVLAIEAAKETRS